MKASRTLFQSVHREPFNSYAYLLIDTRRFKEGSTAGGFIGSEEDALFLRLALAVFYIGEGTDTETEARMSKHFALAKAKYASTLPSSARQAAAEESDESDEDAGRALQRRYNRGEILSHRRFAFLFIEFVFIDFVFFSQVLMSAKLLKFWNRQVTNKAVKLFSTSSPT